MGALGAYASVVLSGTKTGAVLAAGCIFGPALAYAALVAPLYFPFLAYVAVVPLDNVLPLSGVGTLAKLFGIASGGAVAFYVIRTRKAIEPPRVFIAWVLLFLWMFASTLWAIDPEVSFAALPTALQLFGLYAIISLIPVTFRQLRAIVITIILTFSFASAYGAYLFHSGSALSSAGRLLLSDTESNGYIDPNQFAAALLLPIALAIMCALRAQNKIAKVGYSAAIIVMMAGLAVTASRGALLGLAAIVVYFFFRTPYRKQLALLIFGMAASGGAMFGQLISRFGTAAQTGGAGRLDIWRVGWLAFKTHWLAGAGYNNFPLAYDQSYIHVAQHYWARWHRAPHDLLIGTSVEIGIIGLVLLLIAWFGHFDVMRRVGTGDPRFGLRVAVEASLIGLFIAALFLDMMNTKYIWLVFMLAVFIRNAKPERVPNGSAVPAVLPSVR